ncbi:MAG: hypothetical protein ACFCBW_19755 [Candidatus Competibacterales bacterium]
MTAMFDFVRLSRAPMLWGALVWLVAVEVVARTTYYYPSRSRADYAFQIPSGWTLEPQEEGPELQSPSGHISVTFVTVRESQERALNLLVAETELILGYELQNPSVQEGGFQPLALEKLRGIQFKARGEGNDGQEKVMDFVIVSPKTRVWILVHATSDVVAPRGEQAQLIQLFDSLGPA